LKVLLLLLTFATTSVAQNADSGLAEGKSATKGAALPATIRPDLKQFDKEIARAAREYLEAAERARKKTVAALAKDMEVSMKRKDLETAIKIKEKIEEIKTADLWVVGKPKPVSQGNGSFTPDVRKFAIGDGFWGTQDYQYGVVVAGNDIWYVQLGKKKNSSSKLIWNSENGEYAFGGGVLALRQTVQGLAMVNYSKSKTNPKITLLRRTSLDKLKN
jgi:hypothetical protein